MLDIEPSSLRMPMTPHPLESNLWVMQRDFSRFDAAIVHDDPDLLWYSTPGTNSWMNGASRCDLKDNIDERIGEVIASADTAGMATMWHQTPSCRPRDLGVRLEQHGFEATPEPGMTMATGQPLEKPPMELAISQVTDRAEVLEWGNTFDLAFGGEPRGERHPWLFAFSALYLEPSSIGRLFIGRVDGVAVATSLAVLGGGVVGLYGVGTVPDRRGQGYGGALTAAGVEWGRKQGASLAVLASSELGLSVYERLGFRTALELTSWFRPDSAAA